MLGRVLSLVVLMMEATMALNWLVGGGSVGGGMLTRYPG